MKLKIALSVLCLGMMTGPVHAWDPIGEFRKDFRIIKLILKHHHSCEAIRAIRDVPVPSQKFSNIEIKKLNSRDCISNKGAKKYSSVH